MPKVTLNGEVVPYTVKESKRARRVSIKIDTKTGLQLVIPEGMVIPNADIEAIMMSRADWILRQRARLAEVEASLPRREFVNGEAFPYLGEDKTLEVVVKPRGKSTTVAVDGDTLRVSLPPDTPEAEQPDAVRKALDNWLQKEAKAYIPQRVEELAARYGFEYGRVSIKNQRTRWGSCSSLGNLNFNRRLMMTPPGAIDYLIIHELCHLREMNHSPRYWKLVGQYCQDYKYWRKWLKDNTIYLTL